MGGFLSPRIKRWQVPALRGCKNLEHRGLAESDRLEAQRVENRGFPPFRTLLILELFGSSGVRERDNEQQQSQDLEGFWSVMQTPQPAGSPLTIGAL